MALGLHAYRVDLALLATLPRSSAPEFAALSRRLARRLKEIDLANDEDIASGEVEPAKQTLARLCDGKARGHDDNVGFIVEALCGALGKRLAAPVWERFATSFFSDLDDELTARGLKKKDAWVSIVQSGVPVGKLRVRAPECGAVPPEQVARVARLMDAMDLSDLDPDQRRGAAEWRKWLRAADEHQQALVIFNY